MSLSAHGGYSLKLAALFFTFASACPALAASDLVWQTGPGYRFARLSAPKGSGPGFTLLTPAQTGITFSNRLTDATVARNRLYEIGSGVALGDVDGDGLVDIYFCSLEGANVLYRNLGNWRFEDVTAASGLVCSNQFSTGCVFADVYGEGHLDLLLNSLGGGTRLFRNDGKGHFTEQTESGLLRRFGATSMALADVKGDGTLDLFVCNYRTDTVLDHPPGLNVQVSQAPDGTLSVQPSGRFVVLPGRSGVPQVVERGEPSFLYLNRGGGQLLPVPWHVGLFVDEDGLALGEAPGDWGLSVLFRDLNGDGLPDLYVCNDFAHFPDRLWLNQDGRRFQAAPRPALRHTSLASMAIDAADINRDGFDDFFVADMLSPRRESRAWQRPEVMGGAGLSEDPDIRPEVPRNTLQLARGDGTFAEIAVLAGVAATDWTTSALFLDVDLDGWEDLLLATGNKHDVQDADALGPLGRAASWQTPQARLAAFAALPPRAARSLALRNRHDLTFEDTSAAWGFNALGVAHGMALADLDNDGDLDVVVNCMNEPARIYRNNSPAPRVAVRLKGLGRNTRGIGARIKVSGGPVTQTQVMMAGGRFLSSDDPMRVFAAGAATRLEIEVAWRSGRRSLLTNAEPNCIYEIDEAGALPSANPPPAPPAPLFEDVSSKLNHLHLDEPFDDFARQPLLPRKLSTLGPGVGWADLEGNGRDDLLVSAGKGGRLAVFRNDGQGGLVRAKDNPATQTAPRDQTSPLVFHPRAGPAQLIVGESNWEDADTNAPAFRGFALGPDAAANLPSALASGRSATGPLALADVDGDGKLDLFVGGRVVPGRYPEPATSYLLHNDGHSFSVAQTFTNLGLVSGAVFVDFDGDGQPDLALACEWDSIRLFHNDHGKFTEVTAAFGLARFKGYWNGIAVGDFDGDGRLDLVASNWGRNWRTDQGPGPEAPVRLYYGDFAGDGVLGTILASLDPFLSKVTPWRDREAVAAAIPSLVARVPDHHAYGRASIQEVLGEKASIARELSATSFDSMVFLNRGDHFEARPLPIEAQFAPAFGVSVADFDGDGREDVFLAQNFFGVDAETSRQDAGTGLVLLGDGRGGFRALRPQEAGIAIYGEQRGCAVADFDGDGRVDLAVAQHGGPTRLFRNVRAAPGVRVSLRGSPDNPEAIGACVRLRWGDQLGPARELHAGSGYWSQDSSTLVLAAPAPPTGLEVRWPGGRQQLWSWPPGARAIVVSQAGAQAR